MLWFTSDTHFGHANIIRYCNRPFTSVLEMDHEMIQRWNARVGEGDTVYHLGDFAFANQDRIREILSQLKGTKVLIRGNHDRRIKDAKFLAAGFSAVHKALALLTDKVVAVLQHHPDYEMEHAVNGFNFCGHVHKSWTRRGNIINVGVDVRDFQPVTLDELLATP